MKKKKKVRFDEIKIGTHFKRSGCIYVKTDMFDTINIKTGHSIFIYYSDKVIPVTVTIKVKEK